MKVICFYWQGDRWNTDINASDEPHLRRAGIIENDLASRYVSNLYYGVKKFANKDFEFICFTNEKLFVDKQIKLKEFPVMGKGVLPRMWMFSKEAGLFGHQVLCLDIDILIVNSLRNIMNYEGIFCTRSRFVQGEKNMLDGDIMSFRACKENEIRFWRPIVNNLKEVEKITNGRERFWISNVTGDMGDRWDDIAPGEVVSYKIHVRNKGIPKQASVVSFHGYPRPHQAGEEWIKKYWG